MGNVRHKVLQEQLWFQKPTLLSIFIYFWFSVSFSERRHVRRMFTRQRKILFGSPQVNEEFIIFFKSWPSSVINESIVQKLGTITISSFASEEQLLCLKSFGLDLTCSDALGFQGTCHMLFWSLGQTPHDFSAGCWIVRGYILLQTKIFWSRYCHLSSHGYGALWSKCRCL